MIKCTISEGFHFGGPQIPCAFYHIVGKDFRSDIVTAVLIHEFLYVSEHFPRQEVNETFLIVMKKDGVGFFRRYCRRRHRHRHTEDTVKKHRLYFL